MYVSASCVARIVPARTRDRDKKITQIEYLEANSNILNIFLFVRLRNLDEANR